MRASTAKGNAGRILRQEAGLDEVGEEIFEHVLAAAAGRPSVSEELGHQEFLLTYKQFGVSGSACMPASAFTTGERHIVDGGWSNS